MKECEYNRVNLEDRSVNERDADTRKLVRRHVGIYALKGEPKPDAMQYYMMGGVGVQ